MAILKSLNDGGQIEITVLEELPEFNNDVTDHPVEDGSSISDHAALRPGELPLSGVVAGEDAPGKLAILRRWRNERHLLKYTGRNILTNYVIQEFRTEHDVTVRDGFRFRLVLKQVRIVKPAVVELVKADPVTPAPVANVQATSTQSKPVADKGRQQILFPRASLSMALEERGLTLDSSNILNTQNERYKELTIGRTL